MSRTAAIPSLMRSMRAWTDAMSPPAVRRGDRDRVALSRGPRGGTSPSGVVGTTTGNTAEGAAVSLSLSLSTMWCCTIGGAAGRAGTAAMTVCDVCDDAAAAEPDPVTVACEVEPEGPD
jgi:hypothetical protein